jgi:hypothetical protein
LVYQPGRLLIAVTALPAHSQNHARCRTNPVQPDECLVQENQVGQKGLVTGMEVVLFFGCPVGYFSGNTAVLSWHNKQHSNEDEIGKNEQRIKELMSLRFKGIQLLTFQGHIDLLVKYFERLKQLKVT